MADAVDKFMAALLKGSTRPREYRSFEIRPPSEYGGQRLRLHSLIMQHDPYAVGKIMRVGDRVRVYLGVDVHRIDAVGEALGREYSVAGILNYKVLDQETWEAHCPNHRQLIIMRNRGGIGRSDISPDTPSMVSYVTSQSDREAL
eukprot:TRINITY_DN40395_c0_g1_i1.p1 TRINITY_DN40395_c0_g1~~TRINITY_DN40395_c0_g1_i1.p1  ORF type:complete len:152 (+),score=7.33 TRINITY_DN40395_c0_g1_i1:22-456(+)